MGWRSWRFDAVKPLEAAFFVSCLLLFLVPVGILIYVIIDFLADREYLLEIGAFLLFVFLVFGLLLAVMG